MSRERTAHIATPELDRARGLKLPTILAPQVLVVFRELGAHRNAVKAAIDRALELPTELIVMHRVLEDQSILVLVGIPGWAITLQLLVDCVLVLRVAKIPHLPDEWPPGGGHPSQALPGLQHQGDHAPWRKRAVGRGRPGHHARLSVLRRLAWRQLVRSHVRLKRVLKLIDRRFVAKRAV